MIHLIDKSNRRLYLDQLESLSQFVAEKPKASRSLTVEYPDNPDPRNERFDFAMRLQEDGKVAECLQVCHLKDAPALGLIPESVLSGVGRGYFVCEPIRPVTPEGLEPLHTSNRLWIGLMESIARKHERRLVALMDQWRFATAVKAGMPWRKFADAGDHFLYAVMDVDRVMTRRLADQFCLLEPCAYRADRADIQTWGSLDRVEEEFMALRRLLGSRLGSSQALFG